MNGSFKDPGPINIGIGGNVDIGGSTLMLGNSYLIIIPSWSTDIGGRFDHTNILVSFSKDK
jgi:hypothetical protein